MESTDDLASRYRDFSNEKILSLHGNIEAYTPEAKEALQKILDERGGLQVLMEMQIAAERKGVEEKRIRLIIHRAYTFEQNRDKLVRGIKSDLLDEAELRKIVEQQCEVEDELLLDKRVSLRTIIGALLGLCIGSAVGGFILGIIAIKTGIVFYLTLVVPAGIGYAGTRIITRKSYMNPVVILVSTLSLIFAYLFAMWLYRHAELVGIERLNT